MDFQGAAASPSQCSGYGGCAELEMSPPQLVQHKSSLSPQPSSNPAPQQRAEHSMPKYDRKRSESRAERNWSLHRPPTPGERAETRALNRQSFGIHDNEKRPADGRHDNDYIRMQQQYQLELREYQSALQAYELTTRSYPRYSLGPYTSKAPHARQPLTMPPTNYDQWPAQSDEQERLNPWRGYDAGPGNGY